MLKVKKQLLPEGHKARPGTKLEATSITLHWIGPYPSQSVQDPYEWWLKGGGEAAAHYIIKDTVCINTIPIDELAYHCGTPRGNNTSIGIEIIPYNKEGKFSTESIATLAQLLKRLPKLPLKRHFDWTRKLCPLYYVPNTKWYKLVKQLDG